MSGLPKRRDAERQRPPDPGRRQIVVMTLGLCLAVAFYLLMKHVDDGPFELAFPGMGSPGALLEDDSFIAERTLIEPLGGVEERRLREQRNVVDELARRHIGTPLTSGRSMDDLRVIQELLDKKILKKDQTYELQALGIAFGDLLAEQLGLEWVSVEDELGRTRALQYGDSENFVFPVTMISKRVEADVRFTVAELYEKTRSTVEAFRKEPGSTRRLSL